MIHDTQSAQISQKQGGRNIYVIMCNCTSCTQVHEAIVVITGRVHCFLVFMITYIYIYICTYIYIYIFFFYSTAWKVPEIYLDSISLHIRIKKVRIIYLKFNIIRTLIFSKHDIFSLPRNEQAKGVLFHCLLSWSTFVQVVNVDKQSQTPEVFCKKRCS